MSCEERQRDEIAALKAIFDSDFCEITPTSFRLRIVPNPTRSSPDASAVSAVTTLANATSTTPPATLEAARKALAAADDKCGNHSTVFMTVKYPAQYPENELPEVSLEKIRGLTQPQFADLEATVSREVAQRKGAELVFEVSQIAQEFRCFSPPFPNLFTSPHADSLPLKGKLSLSSHLSFPSNFTLKSRGIPPLLFQFLAAHNVKPGSLHAQMMAAEASKAARAPQTSSASSSSSGVSASSSMPSSAQQLLAAAPDQPTQPDRQQETNVGAGTSASVHKKRHALRDTIADIVQKEMERRLLKVSSGTFDIDTPSLLPGESPAGDASEFAQHLLAIKEKQERLKQEAVKKVACPAPSPVVQPPPSPGTSTPRPTPTMPTAIPGYNRLKPLHVKPYGIVFKAVSMTTQEEVIVKTFFIGTSSSGLESESSTVGDKSEALRDLEDFVRSAIEMEHDNIVPFVDIILERDIIYIVEEFIAGGSVKDLLARGKMVPEPDIAKYVGDILRGLCYLNEQQLFHGDLKSSKLMIGESNSIMLADYGILDFLNAITEKHSKIESSSFEDGMKEDVYSLGLLLKELFAKHSGISLAAKEFVAACLTSDPRSRPKPAALLAFPFLTQTSVSTTPPSAESLRSSAELSQSNPSILPVIFSRYKTDFEETESIGRGAFGEVVKARNKLDKRFYAVKKVPFNAGNISLSEKLLREVRTLSTLHHENVVRYYQAWTEDIDPEEDKRLRKGEGGEEDADDEGEEEDEDEEDEEDDAADQSALLGLGGPTEGTYAADDWLGNSQSMGAPPATGPDIVFAAADGAQDESTDGTSTSDDISQKGKGPAKKEAPPMKKVRVPKMLYIQMEFCPKKTLRNVIDERSHTDEDSTWRMFRQIAEGLNHIHTLGIIHRDLKPANIFIDENEQIKIGDFGLSTVVADSTRKAVVNLHDLDTNSSLTSQIGTPIYTSPEVLDKRVKHYNQKVDLYSLGIIFFEMCCPFETRMESAMAIRDIRETRKFPPGFEARRCQEAKIISWLVQPRPEDRPTAAEVLRSPLVPVKLEEELLKSAVNEITRPSTTIFSILMERLMQNTVDPRLSRLFETSQVLPERALFSRELVTERLETVFRRHSATRIETPLLEPKSPLPSAANAVTMVDESGAVFQLRYDTTVSFSRIASQIVVPSGISVKRYDFATVYRKRQSEINALLVASFDVIAAATARTLCDAEVLKTMADMLYEFFPPERWYIRINHIKLIRAIFEVCQISRDIAPHILSVLSSEQGKNLWKQQLKQVGVPEEFLKRLTRFVLLAGVQFEQALQLPEFSQDSMQEGSLAATKLGSEALRELHLLGKNVHSLDIRCRLIMDPWFSLGPNYEGLVFQGVLTDAAMPREAVMAGGRYDALLFRNLVAGGSSGNTNGAVGVTVSVDIIANRISDDSRAKTAMRSSRGRIAALVESDLSWRLAPCDVLVASKSDTRNMEPEKLHVAALLWAKRIRVNLCHEEGTSNSLRRLVAFCEEHKIPWLAIVRERAYLASRMVRLRHLRTGEHDDIHELQLSQCILRGVLGESASSSADGAQLGGSDGDAPPTMASSSGGVTQLVMPSGSNSMFDVAVMHAEGFEWRRKIQEKCIAVLKKPLAQYLNANARLKAIAVDLPIAYLREINAAPQTWERIGLSTEGQRKPNDLERRQFQAMRERAMKLVDVLRNEYSRVPIVAIFSYVDDDFEVIAPSVFASNRGVTPGVIARRASRCLPSQGKPGSRDRRNAVEDGKNA